MATFIYIPFFGGPRHTLEEGEPVTVPQLRELALALHAYANEVADLVDKLIKAGWEALGDGRKVRLRHRSFRTEPQNAELAPGAALTRGAEPWVAAAEPGS
jgi:hypothetical protein